MPEQRVCGQVGPTTHLQHWPNQHGTLHQRHDQIHVPSLMCPGAKAHNQEDSSLTPTGGRDRTRNEPLPIRRPNSAAFAELFCRTVGSMDSAEFFCQYSGFSGLCPTADCRLAPGLAVQMRLLHPRRYTSIHITQNTSLFAISDRSCTAALNSMHSVGSLACTWPQCACPRMGQFTGFRPEWPKFTG